MEITKTTIEEDKPIQYINGGVSFCDLWFEVNNSTLIPRPETEVLIEYIVNKYTNTRIKVIDLGTGSGNIAIVLAKKIEAEVYAVDLSESALETAKRNAKKHNVSDKIKFYNNDWLSDLKLEKVDVIVSNPPYIAEEEWHLLPNNVACYEPKLALFGGKKGLDHYEQIIGSSGSYLVSGGQLIFEIGWNQGKLVCDLMENIGIFKDIKVLKDKEQRNRVVLGIRV